MEGRRALPPLLLVALAGTVIFTSHGNAQTPASTSTDRAIRAGELKLKQKEFALKSRETDLKLDAQRSEWWRTWGICASVLISAVGLGVPAGIAVKTLQGQRRNE